MAHRSNIILPFFLLASLLPGLSKADKLDSLMSVHDTTVITYFIHSTDSLFFEPLHHTKTNIITNFNRYDPVDMAGRFYASLGNIGMASRNLVFDPVINPGFDFGMRAFELITDNSANTRYFQHFLPVTYLNYNSGPRKEQSFRAIQSLHLARVVTLAADFYTINSPGSYYRQKSNDVSFSTTGQYYTRNKRYGIIACYSSNKFVLMENGGIVNDSVFEKDIETDRSLIEVNLQNAENTIKEKTLFVNQYFFLSKPIQEKDTSDSAPQRTPFNAGRLSYSFEFSKKIHLYTDPDPRDSFYQSFDPIIDTIETRDSTWIRSFDNQVSWSNFGPYDTIQKKKMLTEFSFRHQHVEVGGYTSKISLTQLIPGALIIIQPTSYLHLRIKGTYTLGDFNNNGYLLRGTASMDLKTRKGTTGAINFEALFTLQDPAYFYHYYQSNHFRWDNHLNQVNIQKFGLNYRLGKLAVGGNYFILKNYTYLGTDARPVQYDKRFSVVNAYLNNDFRWRVWSFNTQIVYQHSSSDAIKLPALAAKLSLSPIFSLFGNAAIIQPGIDLFYNTSYFADGYMPVTRRFYLQENKKIGNYVYMDLFVNLMIKRFRFFAQMQHLNAFWSKNKYYMVPHYPMQDQAFKFGLSWNFYD